MVMDGRRGNDGARWLPVDENAEGAGGVAAYVRGFDARYLGLALFPVLIENFRRVSFPTSVAASQTVDSVILVCAVAAAAAIACMLALVRDLRFGRPAAGVRRAVLRVALAASIVPFGLFAASSVLCALLVFAAAGALLVIGLVDWLSVLAKAPVRLLAVYCGAGVVLGKVVRGWFVADAELGATAATVVIGVCAVASMALLAWIERDLRAAAPAASGTPADRGCSATADGLVAPGDAASRQDAGARPGPTTLSESLRASLNVVAAGYVLSWFTKGVLSVPPPELIYNHSVWTPIVESLVCAVLLALLFAPGAKSLKFASALDKAHFAAPVMATCMVYFCFIRMIGAGGAFKTALSLVGDWGALAFGVLFLYLSSLSCSERGIPAAAQTAPALLLCVVAYLSGTFLYAWIGNHAMYVQISLITLYLLGITVGLIRRATTGEEARRLERVGKLAAQWGLSAREVEVFQLMTADYSNAAIAESLVISPETVRTHQKRIYAKAGVHKREDLVRKVRESGKA